MLITLIGTTNNDDFLSYAFDSGDQDLQILSGSTTTIVVRNPVNGAITTLNGTGFSFDANQDVVSGTLTGWTTRDSDNATVVTATDLSWNAMAFVAALDQAIDQENEAPLQALFSLQAFTIDGRNSLDRQDIITEGISSNVTLIGSNNGESLGGGSGNDMINPVSSHLDPDGQGDTLVSSGGNDTYVLSDVAFSANWVDMVYADNVAGLVATLNGMTNTGTIVHGNGTDTLVDVATVLVGDGGFSLFATDQNDQFTITTAQDQWMAVYGGRGADTYILTLNGNVRLDFSGSWNEWQGATQGLVINLATGVIANDGFGNIETLSVTQGTGQLEITGTNSADLITGSNANEVFILQGGNDTLAAGNGYDFLRYDRRQMTSGVVVDLAAGTATGSWEGVAFTHTLSGIERLRGTDTFADLLRGAAADERLEGRGGNDTLIGGGGNDTLIGGSGNDLHTGGAGTDIAEMQGVNLADASFVRLADASLQVTSAQGNDRISIDVENINFEDEGRSFAQLSAIAQSLVAIQGDDNGNTINGSTAAEVMIGWGGNDWMTPGGGADTVDGGDGIDMISFFDAAARTVIDLGASTSIINGVTTVIQNFENITGTIFGDLITGDAGANRIRALGDYDWMVGSGGGDTFEGGTGRDTVAYSSAAAGVIASLSTDRGTGGQANGDLYVDVENLTGSSYVDRLTGDNDRNILRGLAGDDFIFGLGGNDTIDGGAGNDMIDGSFGNDRITGGRGNDVIEGGSGWDTALFTGTRAQYTVTTLADGRTTVLHTAGGIDGIDYLSHVEVLQFSDGRLFL